MLLHYSYNNYMFMCSHIMNMRGRRGRDRMVVGVKTTCSISAYHT